MIFAQQHPILDLLASPLHLNTVRENAQLTDQVRQLTESLSELRVSNLQLQNRFDTLNVDFSSYKIVLVPRQFPELMMLRQLRSILVTVLNVLFVFNLLSRMNTQSD